MIAAERLKALPVRLEGIARAKKAMMPTKRGGLATRERRRRQEDIDALDLCHRITNVIARAPEAFAIWYQAQSGAPL